MLLLRGNAEEELIQEAWPDHLFIQIWESEERYKDWQKRFDDFNSELRQRYFTAEEFAVIRSIRELTEYSGRMEFTVL